MPVVGFLKETFNIENIMFNISNIRLQGPIKKPGSLVRQPGYLYS